MISSLVVLLLIISGVAFGIYRLCQDTVNRVILKSKRNILSTADFIEYRSWWDLYRSSLRLLLASVERRINQPKGEMEKVDFFLSYKTIPFFLVLSTIYPIFLLMTQWAIFGGVIYFDSIRLFYSGTGPIEWSATSWRLAFLLTAIIFPALLWHYQHQKNGARRSWFFYSIVILVALSSIAALSVLNGFSSTAAICLFVIATTFLMAAVSQLSIIRLFPISLFLSISASYVLFFSDADPRFGGYGFMSMGFSARALESLYDTSLTKLIWEWAFPNVTIREISPMANVYVYDPAFNKVAFVEFATKTTGLVFLAALLAAIGASVLARKNYLTSLVLSIAMAIGLAYLNCSSLECRSPTLNFLFPIVYIIILFPLINGFMDWVSFSHTRWCLYQGTINQRRPWRWAAIDALGAILFFVIFGVAFVSVSFLVETIAPADIGADPNLLDWFRNYLAPSNQWVLWSRLTIFIPSLLYMSLLFACSITSALPVSRTVRIAAYLKKNVDIPAKLYPAEKAMALFLTAVIIATLIFALIPISITASLL